jgi:hydrogenase small subunit
MARIPARREGEAKPALAEMDVLWITAGLGCDGESISITVATQPSLEDLLFGALPGRIALHLHRCSG